MRANVRVRAGAAAIVFATLAVGVMLPFHGRAEAPPAGQAAGQPAAVSRSGVAATRLIDNDRVSVQRLSARAGLTEEMHKSPLDIVAIQATPGQIEMWIGNDKDRIEKTTGAQGKAWYLSKSEDHALFNRGTTPVDMIVVNLK